MALLFITTLPYPCLIFPAIHTQHGVSMCGIVGPFLSTLDQNLAMSFSLRLICVRAGGTVAVASFIVRLWIEVSAIVLLNTGGGVFIYTPMRGLIKPKQPGHGLLGSL